jgi:type I restriction enzyme, R subunit
MILVFGATGHIGSEEDQRDFEPPEVERRVTSPDSNRRSSKELKRYGDEHEQKYGRLPKTLIFADNDLPHTSHADELVNIAVDVFGRGQSFVRKITGRVDRPLQRIREFRNRPEPGIVVRSTSCRPASTSRIWSSSSSSGR